MFNCCFSKTYFFKWLSGFFAAPVILHLLRLATQTPVTIGESEVTTTCSLIVIGVSGALSFICCYLSGCCNKEKGSCCSGGSDSDKSGGSNSCCS